MPLPRKKQKLYKSKLPDVPYDDHRGCRKLGGWWISLRDASERTVGEEQWWTRPDIDGNVIDPREDFAHGSPSQLKPVWLFQNGDLYLGNWKKKGSKCLEHGFGMCYSNSSDKYRGNVYIGEWVNGTLQGNGISFWLESSETWQKNRLGASPIKKDPKNDRSAGIPFTYRGHFNQDYKDDGEAVVTLKDGTTRRGPWEDGEPVGNWYSHQLAVDVKIKEEPIDESHVVDISGTEGQQQDEDAEHANSNETVTNDDGSDVERQSRIGLIREFIGIEVIGNNPSKATTERYATQLYNEGFESVDMIKTYMEKRHVQSFGWMAELHKEIVIRRIAGGW